MKKLTSETPDTKAKQNLILNIKFPTLATKAELNAEQDNIVKVQILDSSYFRGRIFLVTMVLKICLCLFISQQLIHSG